MKASLPYSTDLLVQTLSVQPDRYGVQVIQALRSFSLFAGHCQLTFPEGTSKTNREILAVFQEIFRLLVGNASSAMSGRGLGPVALAVIDRAHSIPTWKAPSKALSVSLKTLWALPPAMVHPIARALRSDQFKRELEAAFPAAAVSIRFVGGDAERAALVDLLTLSVKRSRHMPINQSPIAAFIGLDHKRLGLGSGPAAAQRRQDRIQRRVGQKVRLAMARRAMKLAQSSSHK